MGLQFRTWEPHKPLINLVSPSVKRAVDTGGLVSINGRRHPLDLIGRVDDLPVRILVALDLGCGLYSSPISCQIPALPFRRLISVDAHKPVIEQLRRQKVDAQEFIPVCSDIKEYVLSLPAQSVDIVFLLDSLEHLPRHDAILVLRCLDYIARRRILIWLPLGECPQDEYDGNPYQLHVSTWRQEDLERLGYHVQVFAGFHRQFNPSVDAAWAMKDFA